MISIINNKRGQAFAETHRPHITCPSHFKSETTQNPATIIKEVWLEDS
jgi:hypothetical protein